MRKVCVLGAGSWGTALAMVLAENYKEVVLWTKCCVQQEEINSRGTNIKYLKDITLPTNIQCSIDMREAVLEADMIILAVPSQAIRSVSRELSSYVKSNQIVVNVAKGLERETGLRMSEVVVSEIKDATYVILSGPSHAEEVAKRLPTTIVVSSCDSEALKVVQTAFMTDAFRVYTNDDVLGVELGGTLKNIIAFGCGVCDGLGYGDNTKSALITRGLTEMKMIGESLGAKEDTFNGLSGVGDLIVTCTSQHSRNRMAGYLMGQGYSKEEAISKVEMVVEGIVATEAVYMKTRCINKEFPILEAIYAIIFNSKAPQEALVELMSRNRKSE